MTSRARLPRRRWRIAALLGAGVMVNYLDRVNLSVSHNSLHAAFGISDLTYGYLLSAYSFTYAACQMPVGVVLDRFGVRRVGRLSTLLWSAASFAAAVAPGIGSLFAARFLLGVGEAPAFPASAKAVAHWFPEDERSFSTAMFDASAKLASALGIPVLGLVLLAVGWRWSFALTGLVSLAYFLVFTLVYREPADDPRLSPAELAHIRRGAEHASAAPLPPPVPVAHLLRQRKMWGLMLGFGAYNYVFYMLLTWLPTYLSTALGIDLQHAFLYTGVPWLVAAAVGLSVPAAIDALLRRGWHPSRTRLVVLGVGTSFGLGILGAATARTAASALFWITVSIAGLAAASPIAWSLPSLLAPRGSVGTMGGMMNFSGQISGIVAPIVTGYAVARLHSYAWAFAIAAGYLAVGVAGYLGLLRSIERIPPPPELLPEALSLGG